MEPTSKRSASSARLLCAAAMLSAQACGGTRDEDPLVLAPGADGGPRLAIDGGADAGRTSPPQPTPTPIPQQPIGEGCGGNRYEGKSRQLDVYMMVDESGSMVPWWLSVTGAIGSFLDAPSAAGIGVGLGLFGRECSADYYSTPRVPIAPLPDNAAALRAAFPVLPVSGTATLPALQGAIAHARAWQTSHPDSKTVVLLVTDGLPSECASSVGNVTDAAREGFEGTPSIPTYVIGLPLLEPLNPIAVAGGTGQAYAADPTNSQALIDVMNKVRGLALPCDYALPSPTADRSLVNLDYRADASAAAQRIPKVPSAAECASSAQGWYYDTANDTRLVACPQTCELLKSGSGQVDVVLGCPTLR